ncbi:Zinc finger protein rsv2 [Choanephora cucurbitarum]|uniref:Zinc finger protein rsv2 n=1 Tax=Choanephora cucurbitarum TaxID=101091 RepID=A0A1C7NSX9_9FUNG|nr:Zinc finger protein rsv2 [Choanephora cucurbitarum]
MSTAVYRFNLMLDMLPYFGFSLNVLVQHQQPPRYADFIDKIRQRLIMYRNTHEEYDMVIEKNDSCCFRVHNDADLRQVFESITEKDQLEIRLKERRIVPLIKPTVIRARSAQKVLIRKDSGISLEDHKLPPLTHSLPSVSVQLPSISSFLMADPQCAPSILSPNPSSHSSHRKHRRTRGHNVPHQVQQPYMCHHIDSNTGKMCCQAFRRSYDLSRHQSIHLKNRPLCRCHTCGKKFTRLDALRRHQRIQGHHTA